MTLNRYFKNTLGIPAEVLIATTLDLTGSPAAFSATLKDFEDNAADGSLAVFWDDDNTALDSGDTAEAGNQTRSFFYAWKQGSITMRSAKIPCAGRVYTSVAYSAGQADIISTIFGGTISVTQIIHVKIVDKTATVLPYPSWEYQATVTSTVNAAITAIAAAINAETNDPVATAAISSTTHLDVTGTYNSRQLDVISYIETSPSQATDASAITKSHSQISKQPIGTYADVKEMEKYFLENNGAVLYTNGGVNPEEFQNIATNVDSSVHYGILIVTAITTARGETRDYSKKRYVLVVVPTASVATLAAL